MMATPTIDLEGAEHIVSDVQLGAAGAALKKRGHIVLVPQPADDCKDPLNWSSRKKLGVLLSTAVAAVLPDYGSATGAATLIPQATYWQASLNTILSSQSGNVAMLGIGGVFAVSWSQVYGRLPVVIWMTTLSIIFAILCAAAEDFNTFLAARILNGFFSATCQATGLMIIKDMYFFHEQVAMVNLWTSFWILSPYLGPLIANGVLSVNPANIALWHWAFGQFAVLSGVSLILLLLFCDETWYNRAIAPSEQPSTAAWISRASGLGRSRPKTSYTEKEAWIRSFVVLTRPVVAMVGVVISLIFLGVIGIATTISVLMNVSYGFEYKNLAAFYIAPMIGVVTGEVAGHIINGYIQRTYIKRSGGQWKPEVRLWVNYIGCGPLLVGLVIFGYALERRWHYIWVAVGWASYLAGIMMSMTGFYQYVLDCYPDAGGEISGWINFFRVLGGFVLSYYMLDLTLGKGPIYAFSMLTIINGCCFLVVPVLQIFGHRLRAIGGPIPYHVPRVTANFKDSTTNMSSTDYASALRAASPADEGKHDELQLESLASAK